MAPPLAVDVSLVRLIWLDPNGKEASFGLWLQPDDASLGETERLDVANAAMNSLDDVVLGTTMLGITGTGIVFTRVTVQNWDFDGTITPKGLHQLRQTSLETTSTVAAQTSTDTGGALVPQSAPCVRIRTATPGRKTRGRVFLPPTGEEFVGDDGNLTPTGQDQYEGIMTNYTADIFAAVVQGLAFGILSRKGGFFTKPAVQFSCDRRIRTQRRRQFRAALR